MSVTFRRAIIQDLDTLVKMEGASFSPEQYHHTSRRGFRYLIQKGNAEIWLADMGGVICGSIVMFYRKNSKFGRMYSINVLPEYQGGAIGKALFEKAEQACKNMGLRGMTLEIRSDNLRHLERYKNNGYARYKEVDNYYPDKQSCIKLRRLFE